MKLLGLDLSYKTGWALFEGSSLVDYGLLVAPEPPGTHPLYDYNQMDRANAVGDYMYTLVMTLQPDFIIIEQTNKGKQRTTQRGLEWIHYSVLSKLRMHYQNKIVYVDTSEWRNKLHIRLDKDQRKHNKSVKQKVARGKITPKHLAVAMINEEFDLSLKLKDNDIADAICLAWYASKIWLPGRFKISQLDDIMKDLL